MCVCVCVCVCVYIYNKGIPRWHNGKELTANAGDTIMRV